MRGKAAWVGILSSVALIATTLVFGAASAQPVTPTIAFLNPSSFATTGERGIIVSDKRTSSGPGCCHDDTYRLSAWTSGAPSGSTVFFTVRQGAIEIELPSLPGSSGKGVWNASWDIPTEILDGPATIDAYLVQQNAILASATQPVTIAKSQDAADISWPRPEGIFGTFSALATSLPSGGATKKAPQGVIDVLYGSSTSRMRVFYTTSAPGQQPDWRICGTADPSSSGQTCTLASGEALGVTAVAAVSNTSAPATFDTRLNGAGDAVAVGLPYEQRPSDFSMSGPSNEKVAKDTQSGRFFCSSTRSLSLKDQYGRGILGANIDVQAVGPTDGLTFHNPKLIGSGSVPDRGDHRAESAYDCTGESASSPSNNPNPDLQGEHQILGAPDEKHMEFTTGKLGDSSFRLRSPAAGSTSFTAWVDETDDGCRANDDRFTTGELAATGVVGWAEDPPVSSPAAPGSIVPCVPSASPSPSPSASASASPSTSPSPTPSPSPSPSASPSPTPSPSFSPTPSPSPSISPTPRPSPSPSPSPVRDGSRSVTLTTKKDGADVILKGHIDAADPACESFQHVVLKSRRPGGRFKVVDEAVTGKAGRYRFERPASNKIYKVVAVKRGFCDRAVSRTIRAS